MDQGLGTEAMDGPDYNRFKTEVLALRDDAVDYIDSHLAPDRALATKYYKGEKLGNEKTGRSQVISTDVRDTVLSILPSLIRIYFSSNQVVEFAPRGPEDIESAQQATDYINYILTQENPGFSIFHSAFKDALVRRTGVIKWYWDERKEVFYEEFGGLGDAELAVLQSDPTLEIVELYGEPVGQPQVVNGQMYMPQIYSLKAKRTTRKGKVTVEAVPPEEFLIERNARCVDESVFVAHRSEKSKSDLYAMGYTEEDLRDVMFGDEFGTNEERIARNQASNESQIEKTTYYECYVRYDLDQDGIAELRRVCFAGNTMLHEAPWDEIPFAVFCPDPEPHLWVGQSVADQTMDIQKIKSAILRNMLDSLASSIHPRTGIVEGQVNLDDVLNDEVGGVIRMRTPGAVMPYLTPFVGKEAFPMLQYMDEVKENRTGMSKASMGLDADALQSTTRAAVAATVSAAQQHIELIARVFAETGMKALMKGLLRTVTKYQDQPKVIRLRGKWVQIDPRAWDATMDVLVNVALGAGTEEEKLQTLAWVTENQKQIIGMGPNNLAGLQNLYNAYAQMLQLRGFKNVDSFFMNPSTTPPPPPKPDPAQMLAELQMMEIKGKMAKDTTDASLKREDMIRKYDLEKDRLDADVFLKVKEIETNSGVKIDTARLKAEMDRDREMFRQGTAMLNSAIADSVADERARTRQ